MNVIKYEFLSEEFISDNSRYTFILIEYTEETSSGPDLIVKQDNFLKEN